jgi:hypothetical protein
MTTPQRPGSRRTRDVEFVTMRTAREALGVALRTVYKLADRDGWRRGVDEQGRITVALDDVRATSRRRRSEDLAAMQVEVGHETYVQILEFERLNEGGWHGTKQTRIRATFGCSVPRYLQLLNIALTLPDVAATNPATVTRIQHARQVAAARRLARALR